MLNNSTNIYHLNSVNYEPIIILPQINKSNTPIINNTKYLKLIHKNYVQTLKPIATNLTNESLYNNIMCDYKGRIFGIGMMKSGTTSLSKYLPFLGYKKTRMSVRYQGLNKFYQFPYSRRYFQLRHYYDITTQILSNEKLLNFFKENSLNSLM